MTKTDRKEDWEEIRKFKVAIRQITNVKDYYFLEKLYLEKYWKENYGEFIKGCSYTYTG